MSPPGSNTRRWRVHESTLTLPLQEVLLVAVPASRKKDPYTGLTSCDVPFALVLAWLLLLLLDLDFPFLPSVLKRPTYDVLLLLGTKNSYISLGR